MAPFGKYTNAIRSGAPLAVVASAGGRGGDWNAPSDSNAGSAMQAPRPRRKRRRLKAK